MSINVSLFLKKNREECNSYEYLINIFIKLKYKFLRLIVYVNFII